MRPRTKRHSANAVHAVITRKVTLTRLSFGAFHLQVPVESQDTQECPKPVVRFRRTGHIAAMFGWLSAADGVVGAAKLLVSER